MDQIIESAWVALKVMAVCRHNILKRRVGPSLSEEDPLVLQLIKLSDEEAEIRQTINNDDVADLLFALAAHMARAVSGCSSRKIAA